MIEFFNVYYFIYILATAALTLLLYFSFRNTSNKAKFWMIFSLVMINFALHFLKLKFEPYKSNYPNSLRKLTGENICAISTIVFPFLFLIKKPWGKDYMFYLGCLSGFLALLIPTERLGKEAFAFDTLRFYICHGIIFVAPFLMVVLGIHKLDYRRVWKVPFMFIGVLTLILLNEVFLLSVGIIKGDLNSFFSRNGRNDSLVFGPSDGFIEYAKPFMYFVPKFFIRELDGEQIFIPVLWAALPILIYFNIFFFIMSLPFEAKHLRKDMARLAKLMKKKESTGS